MVAEATAQSNIELDLDEVEAWLITLHGASQGRLHVCSTGNWSGSTFSADDTAAAVNYISRLHARRPSGIYLRTTTLTRPLGMGERGADSDSMSFPGLWADIDIAGPGHKTNKPLPPTETEAARIITEAGLPEPTWWVHSGGGVYPWWLLEDPITLAGNPDLIASTQEISARWQDVLAAAAARIGYNYGPVGDLSRVMRIPGTVNLKVADNPRPCRMIDTLPHSGQRFTAEMIVDSLAAAEAKMIELAPPTPVNPTVPQIPRQRTAEAPSTPSTPGNRPGDELANQMTWEQILTPHHYQFDRQQGVETYWVRPGKHRRDGHSCTTNYMGSDLLYVFSTEMDGFEAQRTYSKFATWSILNGFGTNFSAAAKALRAQGYGGQYQPATTPRPLDVPPPASGDAGAAAGPVQSQGEFHLTDVGNGRRMAARYGNLFRRCDDLGAWYRWSGKLWEPDSGRFIERKVNELTDAIIAEGKEMVARGEAMGDEQGEKLVKMGKAVEKHGLASQANARVKGALERFQAEEGISIRPDEFDTCKSKITVKNGILDLETGELSDFDPKLMMTRMFAAEFNRDAQAPRFAEFMEKVLPNPQVRDYVQRAMGYTLLGENNRRAIFMLHGPSGTGKSQFLGMMQHLFGDFGDAAAAATFRQRKTEMTNDLHSLRGKRFVTTSETSETSTFDEELIKRITGRDDLVTRDLYQKNITWTPEFAIWLATNFLPKLNSDDNAIWNRVKPIEFATQFSEKEGTATPDIGREILAAEASGILNWLLEGVRKYREHGLSEPEPMGESLAQHRLESDNVAQFVQDALAEGMLVSSPDARIGSMALFTMYERWCNRQRFHAYGQKRFTNRMRALGYQQVKASTMHWQGLSPGSAGIFGTM